MVLNSQRFYYQPVECGLKAQGTLSWRSSVAGGEVCHIFHQGDGRIDISICALQWT